MIWGFVGGYDAGIGMRLYEAFEGILESFAYVCLCICAYRHDVCSQRVYLDLYFGRKRQNLVMAT